MAFVGAPVVTIDGVVVTVAAVPPIADAIGQRGSVQLVAQDTTGTLTIKDGMPLVITDAAGALVYSGWVTAAIGRRAAYAPPLYEWQVTATDNVSLADKRIAATTYAGQTCGFVVGDLLSNYLAAEGVYAVRNLLSANQSDVETNTTGFAALVGATISRDATTAWHGAASLKVVTPGAAAFEGAWASLPVATYQAGAQYTLSAFIKGTAGQTLALWAYSDTIFSFAGTPAVTLTGAWQRLAVTVMLPNPLPSGNLGVRFGTVATLATTFWVDGLQIEPAPVVPGPSAWELGGTSTVAAGPTLTTYAINYESVAKHLDALATLAASWWNIDAARRLWFVPFSTNIAPFVFDGSQADDPDGQTLMALEFTSPLYRNGQYLLGIVGTTGTQTETRKGDGTATSFTFSYPLHAVPTVTLNGAAQTVGIKGVDTGKQWYWNKGDPTLAQDTSGTKLLATDTLQAVYTGEFQSVIYSEDSGAVAARQALEGGGTTGLVQQATTDKTVSTTTQGFQAAAALLAKYATAGTVLTFTTQTGGLASGQLLTVDLPDPPWSLSNAEFLIESVALRYDGFTWWSDVTALDGPVNDTWTHFFQRLAAATTIDTGAAGLSQTVALLQTVSESWTWTESVVETLFACPIFPMTFPMTMC